MRDRAQVFGDTSFGLGHDTLREDRVSARTEGSRSLAAPSTANSPPSSRPTSPEQSVSDDFGEPSRLPVRARGSRDFVRGGLGAYPCRA